MGYEWDTMGFIEITRIYPRKNIKNEDFWPANNRDILGWEIPYK